MVIDVGILLTALAVIALGFILTLGYASLEDRVQSQPSLLFAAMMIMAIVGMVAAWVVEP